MARTQGFDREAAVRAARTLFWTTGFENASIAEIEAATGLSRSSVYNTFGSKRGLFDEAVQSYLTEVVRPRLRPLTSEPVASDAIEAYLIGLRTMFRGHRTTPSSHGCLLVNTAQSPIAYDPDVSRVIVDYLSELRDALERGVRARHPELDGSRASRRAEAMTGLVIAAFSLARVDAAQSARSIDTALDLLDQPVASSAPAPR
ncbi:MULTISPECIES: TetR/AcrR family transcriptional regulator [Bacteria]|uniref:TetR/AcrR family transcriptional regulator n=1 Tax=Bacteria TaxID=2 RepID=UPI003C7CB4E7